MLPRQTSQQVEVIHTSLSGMALISLLLLIGMLLPVLGIIPINSAGLAALVFAVVCIGIGYLYLLNYQAHKAVLEQARLTDVLINSLGQGFLTFDAKGVCGSVFSQASLSFFQTEKIEDRNIADILHVPDDKKTEFHEWLEVLFMPGHALSFEDAARFLPEEFPRGDGRNIFLSYRAVSTKDGHLSRVVLIATDKTEEKEAQKRADNERLFAGMICAIFAERQSFVLTMSELRSLLEHLDKPDAYLLSADFFRHVHTVKGAVMHFKMDTLGEKIHELETVLRQAKEGVLGDMRGLLDQSRAEVQLEYGRIQNALRGIMGEEEDRPHGLIEVDEDSLYQFSSVLKQNSVPPDVLHAYQKTILSVPLFSLLKSLDRQMFPLAEKLGKKIKPIIFKGEAVRLPARPLQRLLLALTHVVHNILDHGIEAPITRMAKGKDAFGQVTVEVVRSRDEEGKRWIDIIIADDGAGIDPNRVRAKLMAADPEGSWRFDDDQAVIQQLLVHDVSTRDEATLFSGRGAGMSAVYHEVMQLGGRMELRSEMHKGTKLVMQLPETIANRLEI
jgi:two-component system chemotaxis sensor kinase CheA